MGLLPETESYSQAAELVLPLLKGLKKYYVDIECKGKLLMFELPP